MFLNIKMKMSSLLLLIASLAICSAANGTSKLKEGARTEIGGALQPAEEKIFAGLSSICGSVKKLFRVSYEDYEGENEPQVDQLTLEYIVPGKVTTYNITTAAELIPKSPEFDPEEILYLFVHGFTDDPSKKNFQIINDALSNKGYVLALNASSFIGKMYLRSSTYIRFIGEKLGEVLAAMSDNGLDPADIHIIGHSLGAHISAFAGKEFANTTGYNVSRITGLDPAGPCFAGIDPELKLKATDADFVDVIHTNAGILGLKEAVGQVDYFPNGGHLQTNCSSQTLSPSCSHSRAVELFAESVGSPKAFLALKCKDYEAFKKGECEHDISPMGFASKPGTTGLYYLQTAGVSPYGLGKEGLTWKKDEGKVGTTGSKVSQD